MDQNFRKRLQKTLYSGELEPEHCPLALTDLAVEYFQGLSPHKLGHVDLQSASTITSQDTVSPASVAMSMMYAKRLQHKRPDYVRKMSSSDLFIISMMMASKYLYDEGVDEEVFNDEWAENAAMDKEEVNNMELDFLEAMDWGLFIKKDDFEQAMSSMEKRIALKEGLKRGWFSYTDLCLLLDDPMMQLSMSDVGLEWLKVVFVSSAAYFAGVMTMVGSTVLVTNVSLALSSGMLPMLHPGLHMTPSIQPGVVPPSLSPLPMLEFPREIPHPSSAGFHSNETGDAAEKDEDAPVPVSENHDQPRMPGKAVLDTIMSQLMAVLMLKSHLMQFMYTVSDNYLSTAKGNNSAKKAPRSTAGSCVETPEEIRVEDEEENPLADAEILRWLENEGAANLVDIPGSCVYCKRKQRMSANGCGLDSGFMLPGSSFQQSARNRCWKVFMKQHELSDNGWWHDRFVRQRYEPQQAHTCRTELGLNGHCSKEGLTSMQSLFPDIAIGFSTSMPPPVYAT